jgi:Asp-tRNA(Asn)/Glu-tRNA(Gln) amidotransferase A subunit family amidase
MNKLFELTGSEALTRLRKGRLSAEALAVACLERVEARDADVHAWACWNREHVLAQARECDARQAAGAALGPLHGLPIGIKDVIATRDLPTQHNSPHYQGAQPSADAGCVALLRSAGAVIFGKTETVEFAATGRRPATRNPHDLTRSPGGSSSGSAAAVADCHVPMALATQTGGSTIRPASFCGVWALKPTWGLVGREGVKPYAPTLDTVGWMSRSADDLRLLLDVFDAEPVPPAEPPFRLAGARIAVCRTPMWRSADSQGQAAIQSTETLLRDAGANVELLNLPPPFDELAAQQMRIMRAEGQASFLDAFRRHGDAFNENLRDQVLNVDGTSRAELCAAWDTAAACRPRFDAAASGFDAVVTPSATGVAPQGLHNTGDLVFNGMWTLLHVPCVNVPGLAGDASLPIGITVTGPRFADRQVLDVAAAIGRLFAQRQSAHPDFKRPGVRL